MTRTHLVAAGAAAFLVAAAPAISAAQASRSSTSTSTARVEAAVSAPISGVRYEITFDRATAPAGRVGIAMTFVPGSTEPVLLSIPAWTPGAYEISNFARWVTAFEAAADGRAVRWDKLDHDTWRVHQGSARSVTVRFSYVADTLDNAMAWAQPDFLLLNGTTVFMYPEGRPLDFAAQVSVRTEDGWRVATGMKSTGAPRTFSSTSYHDLVDMPFFIGAFDVDSMWIAERWVRLATYPAGSHTGTARTRTWDQIARLIPTQAEVFGEIPFETYTILQVAEASYPYASGLEHQNSHVNVINPMVIQSDILPSLVAHEIFHAWNVKRLRPAELWPYRYDAPQPTTLLWMSEGITDYYADLTQLRSGVTDSAAFLRTTAAKIDEVLMAPPVALEDASLSTWIQPQDGTSYLYYTKGSLLGLMLDIMIRDASDNGASLDEVMQELYRETYAVGRGFTDQDFWRIASRAAEKPLDDVRARYVDGREAYPWATLLPLAGLRYIADTIREPRLGVFTLQEPEGVRISSLVPGGAAATAGVQAGDLLLAVGEIAVEDVQFGMKFRERYARSNEKTLPLEVRRGEQVLKLTAPLTFAIRTEASIEVDTGASERAARIRRGIFSGAGSSRQTGRNGR